MIYLVGCRVRDACRLGFGDGKLLKAYGGNNSCSSIYNNEGNSGRNSNNYICNNSHNSCARTLGSKGLYATLIINCSAHICFAVDRRMGQGLSHDKVREAFWFRGSSVKSSL